MYRRLLGGRSGGKGGRDDTRQRNFTKEMEIVRRTNKARESYPLKKRKKEKLKKKTYRAKQQNPKHTQKKKKKSRNV